MKTNEEILAEISGYTVAELKERQTEAIIQPVDCLSAMQRVAESSDKQNKMECRVFMPTKYSTDASKCQFCGRYSWEHK